MKSISAQDLRIGNCLSYKGVIKAINVNNILSIANGYSSYVEPVALNPEILLRAGFEYRKETSNFHLAGFEVYVRGDYFGVNFTGFGLQIREFKYVHELQNLFYSISGHELTIEL